MASGDSFFISQEAGNGNTWSYTATADLVITGYSMQGTQIYYGTFATSTSGIYRYLPENGQAEPLNKLVLKSGGTITADHSNVNAYGVFVCGFEL